MVGSSNSATLRMANGNEKNFHGPLEIVSATGTMACNGIHVHLAVSDEDGNDLLDGCKIHTTAEICILRSIKTFKRVFDPETGNKDFKFKILFKAYNKKV
jgi:uncharacterized protein